MKRETLFTLLLALLIIIALLQTFQLTGLKGKITSNTVQEVNFQDEKQSLDFEEENLQKIIKNERQK